MRLAKMTPTKVTIDREEVISSSPVKLVDEVILRANSEKASDIHIEPAEHECRVRIRVDGSLSYLGRYEKKLHEEVVARLKVLAQLRTDIRTSPQDGRFKVNISASSGHVATGGLNIRLSLVPTFCGEKCVLRLLPSALQAHTLESLGFSETDRAKINRTIAEPNGMILVVGPTGSGKTTTLYTLLQMLAKPDVSVVTLEDPIEYQVPGITQIPVHSAISVSGLTFSGALRSVVRQDPDIIMVGEIRDSVTAELSTHAALTGHLLISTLHTNDAVTALPRLIDMGVEPFLIASTVRAVISQRLVRKLCQKCKLERSITKSELEYIQKNGQTMLEKMPAPPKKIFAAHGCAECGGKGYKGRTVVSEVLQMDEKLKELTMQKTSAFELDSAALVAGMVPLKIDALQKVLQGVTTLDEISLVCA